MSEGSAVPSRLGPYRVVRPVARGGMASVFEVIEPGSGRHLALKLLDRTTSTGRHVPGREFRALTRLDHPNIVRVYRFGETDDGTPFLTMELLDGVAAQVYAKSCGRPGTPERTREAVRLVREVCQALAYLHHRGIVHRDLKSSNVLVGRGGQVKLLDFGTARLADAAEAITRQGEFIGTYAYAAPEQLAGEQVDARTDLYSVGVLFYRLLTGQRPFDADSPEALRRQHITVLPRHPCEVVSGLPPEVGALVMALLRKAPEERPDSASHVIEALQRFVGDRPAPGRLAEPQVVGRAEVVREVRQLLGQGEQAYGRAVVLAGPPGVGASRVLRQVAIDAELLDYTVLQEALGRGPGVVGLAGLVRSVCRWASVRSDPDFALVLTGLGRPDALRSERLVPAVVGILRRALASRSRPTLLALRGLERVDATALSVLQSLSTPDVPVVLCGALCPAGPDARERLATSWPAATPIDLGPLSLADTQRLIGVVLGVRAPPAALVRRLHAATGGMPGFSVAVLQRMMRDGLMGSGASPAADLSGGLVPIPAGAAASVAAELSRCSAEQRRVVEVLAVARDGVPDAVLAELSQVDARALSASVEALQQRGLAVGGDTVRVAGRLVGRVVRDAVGPERVLDIVRRLCARLDGQAPSSARVRLWLQVGELARATRTAIRWAERSLADGRPEEVVPVVARVVRAWKGLQPPRDPPAALVLLEVEARVRLRPGAPRTAAALEALEARSDVPAGPRAWWHGVHLRWRPDPDGAARALEAASELALRGGDLRLLMQVQLEQARECVRRGDAAAASLRLDRVERLVARVDEPAARLSVAMERAQLARLQCNPARALQILSEASPVAEACGRVLRLAAAKARAACDLGDWTQALTVHLEPALMVARTGEAVRAHQELLIVAARARLALFQLGESRELLAELTALHVPAPVERRVEAGWIKGRLHLAAGSVDTAVRELSDALELARSMALPLEQARVGAQLAVALARGARLDESRTVRRMAERLAADTELEALAVEVEVARALCRAAGDTTMSAVPGSKLQRLAETAPLAARVRAARAMWAVSRHNRDRDPTAAPGEATLGALDAMMDGAGAEVRAALRVHPWRLAHPKLVLSKP